jgi:4-hydroxybenzoate polyprenyltransferase
MGVRLRIPPSLRRRVLWRLRDLANLFRPWFLLPSMFSVGAGVMMANRFSASAPGVDPVLLLSGLLIVGPLIGGGSIIFNQVIDFPYDSRSPSKTRLPLVRLRFNIRTAYVLSFMLLAAGIVLAYYSGVVIFIGALFASFLGFAYSHPATRLKETPPLGCIVNGVCYGIIPVLIGWWMVDAISWSALAMGLPLAIVLASGYMLLGLPDAGFDAMAGVRTLPVLLGHRRTVITSILLVGSAGLVACLMIILGWYPSASLVVLPILVSVMAIHWRLLDRDKLSETFNQLRYLYLVLGVIFLVSLTM